MTLEIEKPELLVRVRAEIESRRLNNTDERIEQALDALDEKFPAPAVAGAQDIEELFALCGA